MAESVGFLQDDEAAGKQLGFDLAEDRAVVKGIPCAGPLWCRHGKEILSANGLGAAMKKHSSRGSLGAGLRIFDDVHGVLILKRQRPGTFFCPQPPLVG